MFLIFCIQTVGGNNHKNSFVASVNSFVVVGEEEEVTLGKAPIIYKDQLIGGQKPQMNNNPMYQRKKRGPRMSDFGQVMGDDVMANDMVMDDIVNEMEGEGDNMNDDNDNLLPRYHRTTE